MMGQYPVFLPGFEQPLSCDELSNALENKANPGDRFRIHLGGKGLPWPRYPRYLWDDASSASDLSPPAGSSTSLVLTLSVRHLGNLIGGVLPPLFARYNL
jgi:hypothetical protein